MAGLPLKSGADFYNLEASRMRLHNLGADPTEVGAGLIYFNTSTGLNTSKKARLYTGSAWKTIAFSEDLDVASNADFLALKDKVELLSGDVDTDAIINNMKEVSAFLAGFAEDASLMDLLNGKLDKTGGTITSASTPLIINRTNNQNPIITYQVDGKLVGVLGFNVDGDLVVSPNRTTNSAYYNVIHAGNIGEYKARGFEMPALTNTDLDTLNTIDLVGNGYYAGDGNGNANSPHTTYGLQIWRVAGGYFGQLAFGSNNNLYTRVYNDTNWSNWKTIAFTDSNVASATKLQNTRTIWGQSFDGTGNIDASLYIGGDYGLFLNKDNEGIYLTGEGINWHSESNTWLKTIMVFNSSGNVGIGTTNPQYKLDVNGEIRTTDLAYFNVGIRLNHAKYISSYIKGDDGSTTTEAKSILGINASNSLLIGYGMQTLGNTGIYGKEIYFAPNGEAVRVRISESGAVYINSAVASDDTEKLIVGGTMRISAIVSQMSTQKRTVMSGSSDSLIFGDDKGLTFFRGSEIAFQTQIGGARNMTMTWNDGNPRVGIGTSTPTEKLHVVGNLLVEGNIIATGEVSAGGAGEESEEGGTTGGGDALIYSQEFTPSTTSVSIAHNLSSTKGVIVQVWEKDTIAGTWNMVLVDIEEVDSNNIKLNFGRTETTLHKVVVMG